MTPVEFNRVIDRVSKSKVHKTFSRELGFANLTSPNGLRSTIKRETDIHDAKYILQQHKISLYEEEHNSGLDT